MDWLVRGGIMMAPILLFSVIALGTFLERLWVLRRDLILPEEALRELENFLKKKMIPEARTYCQQHPSPLARILFAGLQQYGNARDLIKENMEERGKAEDLDLKKYIGLLHTIASVSPLLGLLGTVSGMIKVFGTISVEGVGNPASLATGISEALITTAAGLLIALGAVIPYSIFTSMAENVELEMDEASSEMLEFLANEAEKGSAASAS